MDNILQAIINDVNKNTEEEITVSLNISEVTSVTKVLLKVYNEFVKSEQDGFNFSNEMQYFLNSLSSAYEKLNNVI